MTPAHRVEIVETDLAGSEPRSGFAENIPLTGIQHSGRVFQTSHVPGSDSCRNDLRPLRDAFRQTRCHGRTLAYL